MRPVACLITDRQRLVTPTPEGVIDQIRDASRNGIPLVQIRERDLEGRALFDLVCAAVAAVKGSRTRVIVNDRVDVALAARAHGVHLRGDSCAAGRVRAMVPLGFLIGRSVRSVAEVRASSVCGADYVQFGTVFETSAKPGMAGAGLNALHDVVRATALPVLAVGGITRARVEMVCEAGAAGYAAIGLFIGTGHG